MNAWRPGGFVSLENVMKDTTPARIAAITMAIAIAAVCAPAIAMAGIAEDHTWAPNGSHFKTPDGAAYCEPGEATSLYCWTPNDGFWVAFRDTRPATGYGAQGGMWPTYPTLRYGKTWRWSWYCTGPHCGAPVRYRCTSRRTGLTCTERESGHGFWLGRYRGYRIY